VSERTMYITEIEAWTLDDLIRHTWTDEGRNIGKGLLIKVFAVLREFEARRANPPASLPIALTEEECWVIDYHIRRGYVDVSGNAIGRQLLIKVFGVLLSLRNNETVRRLQLRDVEGGIDEGEPRRRWDELKEYLDKNNEEGPEGPKDQRK
jgi:hypothetical protein